MNNWNTDLKWLIESLEQRSDTPQFKDDNQQWVYEMRAPGCEKEDFTIKFKQGVLDVKCKGSPHTSQFTHRYSLPDFIEDKHISSKYESGILTITIEKPTEAQEVEIKVK